MSKTFPARGTHTSHNAALQPIVSTKLVPPRGLGRLVPRDRLLEQLLQARHLRCLLIQGSAGYGKTTTLVEWCEALRPLGFDVAWLSLTQDDNDLAHCLDYLLASVAQVDPDISREANMLDGRGVDREAVERTMIALVRAIARHRRELVVVLDDFHCITDPGIHDALQWLLDYAPANLHLVFVSRVALPLSLARLRSQAMTLELAVSDLRFTLAESEQFLKLQLGDIDKKTAQRLHELTDGWVAGLQLLSVEWNKRRQRSDSIKSLDDFVRVHLLDDRTFVGYFEREVLSRLSADELHLLVRAAACSRFCASLCAALQGQAGVADTQALLARLESDNLFIVPIDRSESETWYRLHPLLREILLDRFKNFDPAVRHEVHARAWVWFRDRGHLDEAVHHAVHAGESELAAHLLEQSAQQLFAKGELRKLVGLVRQLPEAQWQSRIELRIWMVRVQLFARELDACAASIAQLEADVPLSDVVDRFKLTLLRASLAVQRDDTDSALAILPQLLHPPEGADPIALGGAVNILSWLYMHRGEYDRARQLQLDAPKLMIHGVPLIGTSAGLLQGRCLVGLSYALEGKVRQAERVYRAVLHEAELKGKACAEPGYLAAALLAEVLYELGETDAARELLESRVDVLERVSIPDSVLRVLLMLSKTRWLAGHRLEAFAYLDRLEDYALQLGLDRLLAHSLVEKLHRHILLEQFNEAQVEMARLEALEARYPHADQSSRGTIALTVQRARVRWCMARGRYEDAAAWLERLIALYQARGRQRLVAHLILQRGIVQMQLGQRDAAYASVEEALWLGHRLGLVRSLLDADPGAWDLIVEVARDRALDPMLVFYVEQLELRHQAASALVEPKASPKLKRGAAGTELLSEREIDVVRHLAEALPNKKIARALGLSPETVKWHLSNIYGKLGVSGRDEAVARVRDIEWGSPHEPPARARTR